MFVRFYMICLCVFFLFKQKTAYEMRISDWSSDVCSSDLLAAAVECLHETGYAGASTLAVAKRAGVSRGALMKQFQSKATLFADLVEHLLDEMRAETEIGRAHV